MSRGQSDVTRGAAGRVASPRHHSDGDVPRWASRRVLGHLGAILLAGCSLSTPEAPPAVSHTPSVPATSSAPAAAVPADLLNPAVNQQTIRSTICVPGWTATVRPPSSYTNRVKRQQLAAMAAQHPNTNTDPRAWQLDHTMPLTLGGATHDVRNLSPIPWAVAYKKDAVARRLNKRVCGTAALPLDTARQQMLNWKSVT